MEEQKFRGRFIPLSRLVAQETMAMSKWHKNQTSEVAYFIDFNYVVFDMFKTCVLLISSDCLELDFRNVL